MLLFCTGLWDSFHAKQVKVRLVELGYRVKRSQDVLVISWGIKKKTAAAAPAAGAKRKGDVLGMRVQAQV